MVRSNHPTPIARWKLVVRKMPELTPSTPNTTLMARKTESCRRTMSDTFSLRSENECADLETVRSDSVRSEGVKDKDDHSELEEDGCDVERRSSV